MTIDRKIRGLDDIWTGIVIHHTGVGKRDIEQISTSLWHRLYKGVINWLSTDDSNYVSAHYVISRNGEFTCVVDPDSYIAFHAGKSSFWNPIQRKFVQHCNDFMIGIELVGDGNKGRFSKEQYHTLAKLCRYLLDKFKSIEPQCITGHEVVSPGRKVDPGFYFDWRRFFNDLYS